MVGILSSEGGSHAEILRADGTQVQRGEGRAVATRRAGADWGQASGTHSVLPFRGSPPGLWAVLVCRLLVEPGPLTCELGFVP